MIKYLVCLLWFATLAASLSLPAGNLRGGRNFKSTKIPRLEQLGQVGDKSYHIDTVEYGNYTDAKALCERAGMELGTVETDEEYEFLMESLPPKWYFWTAARDSHTRDQLSWEHADGSQTEITGKVEVFLSALLTKPLTCGVVSSTFGIPVFMSMIPCSYTSVAGGTLCQAVDGLKG